MGKIVNKRIFFWGSRKLGLKCFEYILSLKRIIPGIEIIGVCISERDIANGKLEGKEIVRLAKLRNIPVYSENNTTNISADIGLAIGYPHKISLDLIKSVKNGIINLHFAPLPYYRGSKTLAHAILNNEKRYGLSLHYIDENLDTGPLIDVKWYDLGEKTNEVATNELENVGFEFFKEHFDAILQNQVKGVDQKTLMEEKNIIPKFYTRKSLKPYYKVSKSESFDRIYQIVRALQTGNGKQPYFEKEGKKIYLSIKES